MRTFSLFTRLASTIVLVAASSFMLALPAAADDQYPQQDAQQAPGVARISLINGNVSVKRSDSGDTVAAAINAPVEAGDYITTGNNARAEIQLDDGTMIRAGANTQLRFTQLDNNGQTAQIASGTVMLRVFHGVDAHPIVETPSISVRPNANGAYRITVTDDGNTLVTVRAGDAYLDSPQSSQELAENQTMLVSGSASAPQLHTVDTIAMDNFDQWNEGLDNAVASANSNNYVNNNVAGGYDLGQYGSWINNPNYGYVWSPYVGPGWAPYRYGQWSWVNYYGWTWVSTEPWGWAPYHYGNWFFAGNRWCWSPGFGRVAPVWSPGIVAFFNFGNVGVGFNTIGNPYGIHPWGGSIGWVPVGPGEPFHRWWGGGFNNGFNGGRTVVINNTTNIINVYKGFGHGGGSGIGVGNWNNGQFAHNVTPLPPNELRRVGLAKGPLPIVPTNHNLAFTNRSVNVAHLPQASTHNFVGFHNQPRMSTVGSFDEQRRAMQSIAQGRRVAAVPHVVTKQSENPARVMTNPAQNPSHVVRGNDTPSNTWHGMGASTQPHTAFNSNPSTVHNGNSDVWNRFGTGAPGGDPRRQTQQPGQSRPAYGSNNVHQPQVITGNDPQRRATQPQMQRQVTQPQMQRQETQPQAARPDVWSRFGTQPGNYRGDASNAGSVQTYSRGSNGSAQTYGNDGRGSGGYQRATTYGNAPTRYSTGGTNSGYGDRPSYAQPRQYNGGGYQSTPRQYNGGGYQSTPRQYNGGGYQSQPRQYNGGAMSEPRQYSAPAPRQSYGGQTGGGYSGGSRGYGGGGGYSGGGGGGYHGGGGGGGRPPSGGGGGGGGHSGGHTH